MLAYRDIAELLDSIGCLESRNSKAEIASDFIRSMPLPSLCHAVRLLMGELWPSWEGREMGVGHAIIIRAISSVAGSASVAAIREYVRDPGELAARALVNRSQSPLSAEPLGIEEVYQDLLRISDESGPGSDSRKEAILRGLFLRASPTEGRYIARTAMRSRYCGLGPRSMALAIARAFSLDEPAVWAAYSRFPEMGIIALAAARGRLQETRITPGIPIREMQFSRASIDGKEICSADSVYMVKYDGIRVQVHLAGGKFHVFTSRRRDITRSLSSLANAIRSIDRDLIMGAELVGFKTGMVSVAEVVSFINRRHLSRKSSLSPALAAFDLLFLDGEDLTSLGYSQRLRRLSSLVPASRSGSIFLAEEIDCDKVVSLLKSGVRVVSRHPESTYIPGMVSPKDCILRIAGQGRSGNRRTTSSSIGRDGGD